MPSEFVQQRASYYSERNRDQLESVEQSYMRENDRRMAKFSERN
jgi:hypothetical protein